MIGVTVVDVIGERGGEGSGDGGGDGVFLSSSLYFSSSAAFNLFSSSFFS